MSKVSTLSEVKEVWAIAVMFDGQTEEKLLAPIDDMDCGEFMCFPSKETAEQGIASQRQKGFLDEDDFARSVCLKKREYSSRDEAYDNATA